METNSRLRIPGQVVLGIIAIAMGLLFLLDNLNLIDDRAIRLWWPTIFIIFGILKIVQTRSVPSYFVGGALIFVGSMMILRRLGITYFSWHTWWPIFLILLGVSVVLKAYYRRQHAISTDPTGEGTDSVINAMAILGGYRRRIRSQNFQGGEITAVMGGCEVDLRESSIAGEAVLNIFAMWGGINIKVPADWTVILDGTPILGGFDEKTVTPANNSKRLIIRGMAIMGGVEVRN